MRESESLFADAHQMVEDALAAHYSTGDYASLGMALQDVATEVLQALRLAATHVELMRYARFHSGRIVHGDAE